MLYNTFVTEKQNIIYKILEQNDCQFNTVFYKQTVLAWAAPHQLCSLKFTYNSLKIITSAIY
jgi:hypothetical protein